MRTNLSDRLTSTRCSIDGREFSIEVLRMSNGCIATVSEDPEPKIGAISVSISSDKRTIHSSSLIPDRRGGMLSGMIGDTLIGKFGGIALVSLYLKAEVNSETMKTLINEVGKLVQQD